LYSLCCNILSFVEAAVLFYRFHRQSMQVNSGVTAKNRKAWLLTSAADFSADAITYLFSS
jgi:hypothetical protein